MKPVLSTPLSTLAIALVSLTVLACSNAPDVSVPFASSDDAEMSIAFLARGKLVHFTRHVRSNGDFTPVPAEQPLSKDQAVFRLAPGAKLVLDR